MMHIADLQSRREQVRPQEELVMREKALRDTRVRGINEMEELGRAQELRVSVQKLRESYDTIQLLISQIQDLQERVNCMNDSRPTRRVRFTRAALRQANIRDNKGPSLGKIQVKHPHQRSPYARKCLRQISGRD